MKNRLKRFVVPVHVKPPWPGSGLRIAPRRTQILEKIKN